MFSLIGKTGHQEPGELDRIIWRLLDSPVYDRQVVLMTALQTGELRLSEAPDVLLAVDRIESMGRPIGAVSPQSAPSASDGGPQWQQECRRVLSGANEE
jgi:hypothetical protein